MTAKKMSESDTTLSDNNNNNNTNDKKNCTLKTHAEDDTKVQPVDRCSYMIRSAI